jgi:hypothetical protein
VQLASTRHAGNLCSGVAAAAEVAVAVVVDRAV